jgi:bifunctional DNA-binding transcriptional regulator/antitoxin component of YhaV-PrlF toxin-antitoxin module
MTVTVKKKTPLVVPPAIQRRAGLTVGKQVEFTAIGGVITITPKLPAADDEYTPEQRRIIDARLANARKGPYYGPFDTADEAVKFLRKEIRTRKASKRKPSGR